MLWPCEGEGWGSGMVWGFGCLDARMSEWEDRDAILE